MKKITNWIVKYLCTIDSKWCQRPKQRLLDMRVVLEGTNNHQVIQQLLLMTHKGLAFECSLAEERSLRKKPSRGGHRGS